MTTETKNAEKWDFYETNVAGVTFGERQSTIKKMRALELKRQPENTKDPNAVLILHQGEEIGYVPRELAAMISARLKEGAEVTAKLEEIFDYNGIFAVRICIGMEKGQEAAKPVPAESKEKVIEDDWDLL